MEDRPEVRPCPPGGGWSPGPPVWRPGGPGRGGRARGPPAAGAWRRPGRGPAGGRGGGPASAASCRGSPRAPPPAAGSAHPCACGSSAPRSATGGTREIPVRRSDFYQIKLTLCIVKSAMFRPRDAVSRVTRHGAVCRVTGSQYLQYYLQWTAAARCTLRVRCSCNFLQSEKLHGEVGISALLSNCPLCFLPDVIFQLEFT